MRRHFVVALGNDHLDFLMAKPVSQVAAAVALVSGHRIEPHPVLGTGEQGNRFRTLMALAFSQGADHRFARAFRDQVQLAAPATPAASQRGRQAPFFRCPAA